MIGMLRTFPAFPDGHLGKDRGAGSKLDLCLPPAMGVRPDY